MPYYVYLLECRDQSYYCGYTRDLEQRVKTHNLGRGGRYTRTHLPVKLVYSERCPTRLRAMRREREIKTYGREKKQALVAGKKE